MGRGVADRFAHHGRGGRERTRGHTDRHRAARRRHVVERRGAGERHRDRGTRDRVRRAFGDGVGFETGHRLDLVGHAAPGAAGQGHDGRRHRVAAAPRSRAGHLDVGGVQCAGLVGRHHLDLGAADRDRGRPHRPGQCAAEFGGVVGIGRHSCRADADRWRVHGQRDARRARRELRRSQGHARPGRQAHRVAQIVPRRAEIAGNPWRHSQSRSAGIRARRSRESHDGARGVRLAPARRAGRPRGRRAARRGPAGQGDCRGADRHQRRRGAADHRHRCAAAGRRRSRTRSGGDADPGRTA